MGSVLISTCQHFSKFFSTVSKKCQYFSMLSMKRKKTCVATETIEHVQIHKFKTKFSQPVIVYAYGLFFIKWQKK